MLSDDRSTKMRSRAEPARVASTPNQCTRPAFSRPSVNSAWTALPTVSQAARLRSGSHHAIRRVWLFRRRAEKDRRARLDRAQKRVANLVEAMASGERSAALSNALKEAEAEVEVERGAIADIERLATQPVRLLTVDEVARKVQQIGVLVKSDPISAREELRRCFHRGKIGLHLNAEGAFVARTELVGEIFLVETRTPVQGVNLGRARTDLGSGGRICRCSPSGRLHNPVVP